MKARTDHGHRFAGALLRWYDRDRRDMPWRREVSPYRTLVSETMLQQTVVATVIPYFDRFVARFPDFAALASASEDDVLASWSGLGYYRRARNLHRAAGLVMAQHGGDLPEDEALLRALPGVGPYTAAAVAAICFSARTFALDGNAARVVARVFAERQTIDKPAVRASLRARGLRLVPADRPGDFAQAVMELGARVCVAGAPRCGDCPVATWCAARAAGATAKIPVRSPRRAKRAVHLVCVAVVRAGRVLLVRRRPGELLAGTWALPSVEPTPGEGVATDRALAPLGLAATGRGHERGAIRHVFTHRDVTADVVRVGAVGRLVAGVDQRWIDVAKLDSIALSSFARRTLKLAL